MELKWRPLNDAVYSMDLLINRSHNDNVGGVGVAMHLWGIGARVPLTSNCLMHQVTSQPHKLLTFDSMHFPIQ